MLRGYVHTFRKVGSVGQDKLVLFKGDGTKEEIKYYILIKFPINHPPFMGKCVFNIDSFYVPEILGDHSRWTREEYPK